MSLRDRLILLKDIGISHAFMSEFIGLDSSTVNKYVREEFELNDENYYKLDELSYNLAIALGIE